MIVCDKENGLFTLHTRRTSVRAWRTLFWYI